MECGRHFTVGSGKRRELFAPFYGWWRKGLENYFDGPLLAPLSCAGRVRLGICLLNIRLILGSLATGCFKAPKQPEKQKKEKTVVPNQ